MFVVNSKQHSFYTDQRGALAGLCSYFLRQKCAWRWLKGHPSRTETGGEPTKGFFKEAVHAGEDPIRLISLRAWRETLVLYSQRAGRISFAERLTATPGNEHSDDIHYELLKYFSKQEIAYLTLAVTQINSWNRITRSFGTVPGHYRVRESR